MREPPSEQTPFMGGRTDKGRTNRLRLDVPVELPAGAYLDAVGAEHLAADLAEHDELVGLDVRLHDRLRTDDALLSVYFEYPVALPSSSDDSTSPVTFKVP